MYKKQIFYNLASVANVASLASSKWPKHKKFGTRQAVFQVLHTFAKPGKMTFASLNEQVWLMLHKWSFGINYSTYDMGELTELKKIFPSPQ